MNVGEIRPGMKGVDVVVRVVSVGPSREVVSRKDGTKHVVEEILVGDETGSVILSLWDGDVGKLKEGDVVRIENGYTTLVRGSLRLNVGKYGRLEHVDEDVEANTENNLSEKSAGNSRSFRFPRARDF